MVVVLDGRRRDLLRDMGEPMMGWALFVAAYVVLWLACALDNRRHQ